MTLKRPVSSPPVPRIHETDGKNKPSLPKREYAPIPFSFPEWEMGRLEDSSPVRWPRSAQKRRCRSMEQGLRVRAESRIRRQHSVARAPSRAETSGGIPFQIASRKYCIWAE